MSLRKYFNKFNLTSSQSELIDKLDGFLHSKDSQVFLLKGYAGTGKTFIVKGIVEYFNSIGRSVALAAPTGKAAKVLSKNTNLRACTIHSMIYSLTDLNNRMDELCMNGSYKVNFHIKPNNFSANTLYIIDEASMISNINYDGDIVQFGSGHLLNDLINFIDFNGNEPRKAIFIGDNAQLPPVGMNLSPALDEKYLQDNYKFDIQSYELKDIVRQKNDSGILVNTIPIRQALKDNKFNKLNIDTSYSDINEISNLEFANQYISMMGDDGVNLKEEEYPMMIGYSNSIVSDYNQMIRNRIFPNSNTICVGDRIISHKNNIKYGIYNGDLATVLNVGELEIRDITIPRRDGKQNEQILLGFRDIEAEFENEYGEKRIIKCKIIEDLLYSRDRDLTQEQRKALYVDFNLRYHKAKLPASVNSPEWKTELLNDDYFNALVVKFGYAITCHKAQGSEWNNLFVDCKTNKSKDNSEYFRWLYTAITRAKSNLFIINKPRIGLDFSNYKPINTQDNISNSYINNQPIQNIDNINKNIAKFSFNTKLEEEIYNFILSKISLAGIEIVSIFNQQYSQEYKFSLNNDECKIKVYYNSNNQVTKIMSNDTNTLLVLIKNLLNGLEKHIFAIKAGDVGEFKFDKKFLEDFYKSIKPIFQLQNIEIKDIKHLNYCERYLLSNGLQTCLMDYCYNGKEVFTNYSIKGDNDLKTIVSNILEQLNGK